MIVSDKKRIVNLELLNTDIHRIMKKLTIFNELKKNEQDLYKAGAAAPSESEALAAALDAPCPCVECTCGKRNG